MSVDALLIAAFAGAGAGVGVGAGVGTFAGCLWRQAPAKMSNPTITRRGVVVAPVRWTFMRLRFESVSCFPHRKNMAWLRRIVFHLAAQFRDVDVHRPRHDLDTVPPHLAQKLDA